MMERDIGEDIAEVNKCPICLDTLFNQKPVNVAKCGHLYHVECITEELK